MIPSSDMEVLIMGQRLLREERVTATRLMAAMGLHPDPKGQHLLSEALQLEGLDEGQISAWLRAGETQEL